MIYEFLDCTLDADRRELRCGPEARAIEPQVFSLLLYLVEHRERVVGKEELIDSVWNGRVVSDSTLNTRINAARKAIGDSGKAQAGIRTLPRRGFRFVSEVSVREGSTPRPDTLQGRQSVHFCTVSDRVRIAYAVSGQGAPLVKAPNWMHHLEYDWESPVWGHCLRELSRNRTLLRFDQRGNGLSDWDPADVSFERMVEDLSEVVDAAGFERFPLLGISQGCAFSIAYAHRHPERVSHLILYGGFAVGRAATGIDADRHHAEMRREMIREGWGQNNPAFRQFFTSQFIPGASKTQMDWFNELQRKSVSPETAAQVQEVVDHIDIRSLLPEISVPTLVLHCRDDALVPFESSRHLASKIPGARFVALEGSNHLILEDEPAWRRFLAEVNAFLAEKDTTETACGLPPGR